MLLTINAVSGCDSVSSFSWIGKWKHSRHFKRKLMSWQICLALVSFHHCLWNALSWLPLFISFPLCTSRTKQLQISMNCNMKYLQKECVLRSIATNFESFNFSSARSELSNIYLEFSLCASIGPTVTNWKWIAKERFAVLWKVHTKFVSARCYRWIDEGCKTNLSSCKRANLVCTDFLQTWKFSAYRLTFM